MRAVVILFAAACLAGCASGAMAPVSSGVLVSPGSSDSVTLPHATTGQQNVYWTLFADATEPQLQIAQVPLKTDSKVTSIKYSSQNDLVDASGLTIDSAGRLWILSYAQSNGNPAIALVFNLPLKSTSQPVYKFKLSGTSLSDALTFDPSGNLWVTSPGNSSVLQYTGPFNKSATLTPSMNISGIGSEPYGIAVDSSATVYISDASSSGKQSIQVLKAPYTKASYSMDGVVGPGGLAFDKNGNLYASSDSGKSSALVRYNRNDLKSGGTPSIVDSTGLAVGTYLAGFAFTQQGDLYAADCGKSTNLAGIDVWPLSKKSFSSKLAPSVKYSNPAISAQGCVWGITIE